MSKYVVLGKLDFKFDTIMIQYLKSLKITYDLVAHRITNFDVSFIYFYNKTHIYNSCNHLHH